MEQNYYSVPYQLVRQEVEIRFTGSTVEVLHKGQRVASHALSTGKGKYVTDRRHMPAAHLKYLEWAPSRLVNWGGTIGPHTASLVRTILETRPHPEHGYRSCLGIMRLGKLYPSERMEAGAQRALACGATSYKSLKSILEKGLDRLPLTSEAPMPPVEDHQNLRGATYFANTEGGSLPC